VRQVHQVVDHQPVVAINVVQAAAIHPVRALGPFQVVQLRHVGLRRIARPHPHEAIALDHRIGLDLREAAHALAGHGHGLAVAAHHQPVVAAHQVAFAHRAQGQLRAAVRAEVLHRRHLAVAAAVEGDLLVADGAAQRLVVDLVGHAGDVPGVLGKHGRRSGVGKASMIGLGLPDVYNERCGLILILLAFLSGGRY